MGHSPPYPHPPSRRPPPASDASPSSSWEEASSHCLTALSPSSTITRGYLGDTTDHFTLSPRLTPPLPHPTPSAVSAPRCAHPQLSPELQELQQEVIASVGHDVLRNPGGNKRYLLRGAGEQESGDLGTRWAQVEGKEPRHSRGGDYLILGSPDQQHRALEPSEQSSRRGELRDSQATTEQEPQIEEGCRPRLALGKAPAEPGLTLIARS